MEAQGSRPSFRVIGNGVWHFNIVDPELPATLKRCVTQAERAGLKVVGKRLAYWNPTPVTLFRGFPTVGRTRLYRLNEEVELKARFKVPGLARLKTPIRPHLRHQRIWNRINRWKHQWWVPIVDDGASRFPLLIPPPWIDNETDLLQYEKACEPLHNLSHIESSRSLPALEIERLLEELLDESSRASDAGEGRVFELLIQGLGALFSARESSDVRGAAVLGFQAGMLVQQARHLRERGGIGKKGVLFPGAKQKPATALLLAARNELASEGLMPTAKKVAIRAGAKQLRLSDRKLIWVLADEDLTLEQIRDRLRKS